MLPQIIGVIIGIIGFLFKIPLILIIGGIICLILDLTAFFRGTLNLIFPIILYVLGYVLIGSWIGILIGSIVGNAIEIISPFFVSLISRSKK